MSYTRKLMSVAMFIAFGVILPLAFHFLGGAWSIFLPMHIPVLLAGLLLGAKGGLATGMLTPVVSSLTTGMPPLMPILPVMVAELGIYGIVAGYLYRRCELAVGWSLLGAMLAGRVTAALVVAAMGALLVIPMKPVTYIVGAVAAGAPGIILQLLLIPLLVRRLEAAVGVFGKVKLHG